VIAPAVIETGWQNGSPQYLAGRKERKEGRKGKQK
jgi:hypothetical protein